MTDPAPLSMQQAIELAESGDAQAQYALGALLHQRGLHEESQRWLREAARRLPAARLTLAQLLIDGRHCGRDLAQACALLEPIAAGEPEAHLLLAELHGYSALGIGDRPRALAHLLAAARAGHAGARRQLGLLAALQRLWPLARALLVAAAAAGDACAAQLLRDPAGAWDAAAPAPAADWAALAADLPALAGVPPLPAPQRLAGDPRVTRHPAAFHPLVLAGVRHLAAPEVQRSQVVDATTGQSRIDPMRSSSHAVLGPRLHDHVLEAIAGCMATLTGLSPLHGEFPQVMRYRVGEEFVPHVDYFNEEGAGSHRSLADGGQRVQTLLVYLNDGYQGGATAFPELGFEVQGVRGDLLHFHNVDARGVGHRASLHAGLPVRAGEKWLFSQWIRARPYPPRLAW